MARPNEYILETKGLGRDFRGFVAVQDVNLQVRRGAIHGLIGPNGAGKTTCFNLLTKFLEPSRGRIIFNGQDITTEPPQRIARMGMVRSFQISAVFPQLTVRENLHVALLRKQGYSFHFWKSHRSLARLDERAMQLLQDVGLTSEADTLTAEMPYGRKRALELATTLALDPELMLLDEPTQGMGHEDVERVMDLIQRAAVNRTVLMVEHNMKVIAGICDYITVLTRGSVLAEGDYASVAANPAVIEAYLGTSPAQGESITMPPFSPVQSGVA